MHFSCRSFIGHASDSDWSQFWENEPDNPLAVSSLGHLFGLIHLSSVTSQDLPTIGHQIIDQVNTNYYSPTSLDPSSGLLATISFIRANYPELTIDLALAVVCHHQLYLLSYHRLDIVLKRGHQISHLLSSSDSIQTLSGPVSDHDNIFLSTQAFFDNFGLVIINSALSLPGLESIEEAILSRLYALDHQTAAAAALIQINFDDTDMAPVPSPIPSPPPITTPYPSPPSVPAPPRHTLSGFFSKFSRPKPIYISNSQGHELDRRRRFRVVLTILLLLGLAISSYLGYCRNQQHRLETKFQNLKTELDQKIADSLAVKNLSLDNSLELARQAQQTLDQLTALKVHQNDLISYSGQIQSILSQTGSADSLNLPVFYDTTLITDNPQFSQIYISGDRLFLLDSSNGRIDLIGLAGKNTQKISQSSSIKDAVGLVENQKNLYFFNSKSLYLASSNVATDIIDFSKLNIVPTDIAFWNNSLYILDSTNNSIWKFVPNNTGFGSPANWLKSTKSFPTNSISLAINGNVWILTTDGQIYSYLRGSPEDFKTNSVYQTTTANHLSTTPDGQFLTFGADDSYVYLYRKTGELQAKYNLDDKRILDLTLNSDSTSIYLLCADQKIYQITLP